jgi:hypothetical protein
MLDLTHDGDLLKILSGGGLTSQQDGMKSPHSPSYYALRSLDQAPRHLFGPLNCHAAQVDDEFGGIIAMAETFVRLGLIHTVREVENYIIAVGRVCSFPHFRPEFNKRHDSTFLDPFSYLLPWSTRPYFSVY